MVVMGGRAGVVEVGSVVDEGMSAAVGTAEEKVASVVVETSTDVTSETDSELEIDNAVEVLGSWVAEGDSASVETERLEASVDKLLGLHLGHAPAEATKSGKSDRSRAVESMGAIVAKGAETSDANGNWRGRQLVFDSRRKGTQFAAYEDFSSILTDTPYPDVFLRCLGLIPFFWPRPPTWRVWRGSLGFSSR